MKTSEKIAFVISFILLVTGCIYIAHNVMVIIDPDRVIDKMFEPTIIKDYSYIPMKDNYLIFKTSYADTNIIFGTPSDPDNPFKPNIKTLDYKFAERD